MAGLQLSIVDNSTQRIGRSKCEDSALMLRLYVIDDVVTDPLADQSASLCRHLGTTLYCH